METNFFLNVMWLLYDLGFYDTRTGGLSYLTQNTVRVHYKQHLGKQYVLNVITTRNAGTDRVDKTQRF
jgi:hypothetical protein